MAGWKDKLFRDPVVEQSVHEWTIAAAPGQTVREQSIQSATGSVVSPVGTSSAKASASSRCRGPTTQHQWTASGPPTLPLHRVGAEGPVAANQADSQAPKNSSCRSGKQQRTRRNRGLGNWMPSLPPMPTPPSDAQSTSHASEMTDNVLHHLTHEKSEKVRAPYPWETQQQEAAGPSHQLSPPQGGTIGQSGSSSSQVSFLQPTPAFPFPSVNPESISVALQAAVTAFGQGMAYAQQLQPRQPETFHIGDDEDATDVDWTALAKEQAFH